jgi:hypothetical protein
VKINEIHIYGYGKLEDVIIKDLTNLNVIYGENEAGKSTVMSFIHSMLFGFPTKQQSELRYEPKRLVKYGGKLIVQFPKGRAVIERVKGKATGDVNVTMEDGTHGKEELLNVLMSNIDKNLFQSIFSFNLHGLQNIQQMKSEDLGKFLFSTGALGTDRLLMTETTLQKNLDAQFKPSGKKPVLNEKISQVKQLHHELKRAEQQNDLYWTYIQEKDAQEEQIDSLNKDLLQLQTRQLKIQELKKVEEDLLSAKNQSELLMEKILKVQSELDGKKPNEKMIHQEFAITSAVEKVPLYEQLIQEYTRINLTIEELDEEINVIRQKLHIPFHNENLLNSNTSVFIKEKTASAQTKQLQLKAKKLELDDRFQQGKQDLELVEEKMNQAKVALLPESTRRELQKQSRLVENREYAQRELTELQEQKQFISDSLKQELKREKSQKQQSNIQKWILSGIFLFIGIWGAFSQQWGIAAMAMVAILYLLVFQRNKDEAKGEKFRSELVRLSNKEKELLTILHESKLQPLTEITSQLDKDNKLREQFNMLALRWEQKNEEYDRILQDYEKWEQESHLHDKFLIELGEELNIPKEVSLLFIHDAYMLIDKLKNVSREKQQLVQRAEIIQDDCNRIETSLKDLADQFLLTETSQLQNVAYLLKKTLKQQLELQIQHKELEKKVIDLQMELQLNKNKFEVLLGEKQQLLSLCMDDSVEQLEQFNLDENMNLVKERQKIIQQRIVNVQESLAFTKHQIALIEEGGTYAQILHRYKLAESELNEEAKEWALYAVAKDLLGKAVEEYKNKRLPSLIEKAEAYLRFLTNDNYIRLHSQKEGASFLIEGSDHTFFEPNELSQATSEQIYVALRLALATTLYEKYQFPIIIDDSFVNFDQKRTKKVIQLLRELKGHQILFFTCHDHLLAYFQRDEVVFLSEQTTSNSKKLMRKGSAK